MYSDSASVKDTERTRRAKSSPVILSTIEKNTLIPKDMTSFWPSNQNKIQLEMLIYDYLFEQSLSMNGYPTVLSQLSMDNNEWNNVKIHDGKVNSMQSLQSDLEEADLRFPIHVLDCARSGYKKCVIVSNDTDVIVALI